MTRPGLLLFSVCAVLAVAGCSGPEAPATRVTPEAPPPPPTPPPLTVHVQVPDGAEEAAQAWAEDLRAAIAAGHGALTLSAPEDAQVVVRIDAVETGVEVEPAPEGEGDVSVMRGALLVGVSAREFTLSYRGEARLQAEKLARNLRGFAAEGGSGAPTEGGEEAAPDPEG